MKTFKHFAFLISQLLKERRCSICYTPFTSQNILQKNHKTTEADLQICTLCLTSLAPQKTAYCPKCGYLYEDPTMPVTPCLPCLIKPPPWSNFFFLSQYANQYRKLIIRAKFMSDANAIRILGELLAIRSFDMPKHDVILPIPLHPSRLNQRGFNQSQEIARPLSSSMKTPIIPKLLVRTQATKHQTGLPRKQRLLNVQNAFIAHPDVAGMAILLIDDIMTTGATVYQATKALLAKQAASVNVYVVARTP